MNIYFDGTLISGDYVTGLTFDSKAFNDDEIFKLGLTICSNAQLTVSKDLNTVATNTIQIGNLGTFNVDNIEENEKSYIYTLVDNMVKFNFKYDAQPLIEASQHTESDGTKYVTLLELVQDICTKANVTLRTTSFVGNQKHISWYDNTVTAREYISMVAELNSGYAIDYNGLYIKQYTNTPTDTILLENCASFKLGEKHKITRVAIENGLFQPVGTETGNTVYLNINNVFLTDQQDIVNIYNTINNYEFYSIEAQMGSIVVSTDTIGNCIAFSDGTNTYKTYKQINASYNGGWNGKYHFVVGSIKQEETAEINGVEDNYKRLKLQVDRNKNEIGLVAETKVDESEYSKAEIIARINNGQGVAQINADNINLNGVVTANDNFKILLDGSMEAVNGKFTGGKIELTDNTRLQNPKFLITSSNSHNWQFSDGFGIRTQNTTKEYSVSAFSSIYDASITLYDENISGSSSTTQKYTGIHPGTIYVIDDTVNKTTSLLGTGVTTPKITAGNIQSGTASITNVNAGTTITFDTPFDTVPNVVLTPITTTSGAVSIKIIEITTTYFKAYNSTSQSINACWIAMN